MSKRQNNKTRNTKTNVKSTKQTQNLMSKQQNNKHKN